MKSFRPYLGANRRHFPDWGSLNEFDCRRYINPHPEIPLIKCPFSRCLDRCFPQPKYLQQPLPAYGVGVEIVAIHTACGVRFMKWYTSRTICSPQIKWSANKPIDRAQSPASLTTMATKRATASYQSNRGHIGMGRNHDRGRATRPLPMGDTAGNHNRGQLR